MSENHVVDDIAVGDVVRHEKHGVGVVRDAGQEPRVAYVDGVRRHKVPPPVVMTRAAVISLVEEGDEDSVELDQILFLWLRASDVDVWLRGAAYFASRPSRSSSMLRHMLDGMSPMRRDAIEDRLAMAWTVCQTCIDMGRPRSSLLDVYARQHAVQNAPIRHYQNRCWRCRATVLTEEHSACFACGWLICDCGSCRDPRFGSCYMGTRRINTWTSHQMQRWYK